jgi:predicted nucleotidyltransferase
MRNMKALGLVVEYNPFHNGHLHHLKESIKKTNADVVVAVMSGHFLQRGEPAILSKWIRTKMALECGVDLVVELPYAFATQKAETFANGAISILDALFCDFLCFGSESGDITPFLYTSQFLKESKETYDNSVHSYMKTGVSYPKALTLAFNNLGNNENLLDLTLPNNILGFHYVTAIHKLKSRMQPFTIKRTSAGYHDEHFHSPTIASATSIRKALFSDTANVDNYVPEATMKRLQENKQHYTLHRWENYFHLLKYRILSMTTDEIQSIYEVEEGLENRIMEKILHATSFQDFMERMKTKRYTWTRLQRLCTHLLTNTTKEQMNDVNVSQTSPYIRLLGMSQIGQAYLSKVKKQVHLPIISKLSSFDHPLLHLDIKAANTYFMIYDEPLRSQRLQEEFSTPPIRESFWDK